MLRLSRTMHRETGMDYLCLAGGVALNCVGNGGVLREGPFKGIWIQPAAGDAGGALGAALSAWHQYENKPRTADNIHDKMKGSYLGPAFSNEDVEARLKTLGAVYRRLDEKDLYGLVADELSGRKSRGVASGTYGIWAAISWRAQHSRGCAEHENAVRVEPQD